MTIHHTIGGACPYCGQALDRHWDLERQYTPRPGDVTVCGGCSRVLLFGPGLTLQIPTAAQLEELRQSPDWATIVKVQQASVLARLEGLRQQEKRP